MPWRITIIKEIVMNKSQITNSKFQINIKHQISNKTNTNTVYNLEERTFCFARETTFFCRKLPPTTSNYEYSKQAIRSSGSVGANYIEANESLSKADFLLRIKICRKEAKESAYWFRLIIETNLEQFVKDGIALQKEGTELKRIFCSILEKSRH